MPAPTLTTLLAGLFSLLMLVTCVKRRGGFLWIVLILTLAPYGGLAYLVFLGLTESRRGRALLGLPSRPVNLQPTSGGTATAPGQRALDVADALEAQGRFGEASLVYRRAIEQRSDDVRALHGLGRCLVELDKANDAVEQYHAVMDLDPRYRDYAAALEYAEALHRADRTGDAIGMLEGLVDETGRLNHRLALAHYLEAAGQQPRARGVLNEALAVFEQSPAQEQAANRRWQRQIAERLTSLGEDASSTS